MDAVLRHSAEVQSVAKVFEEDASTLIDLVVEDLRTHLTRSIKLEDGQILRSGQNAAAILSLPTTFDQAIGRSGYNDLVDSFSLELQLQVGHFQNIYAEDANKLKLPTFNISDEDREILSDHAVATLGAMQAITEATRASLVKLIGTSMVQPSMTDLVQGVEAIVRRMSKVKSIAIEQQMTFFRFLAKSTYHVAEESSGPLHYKYVGPEEDSNSELCATFLNDAKQYTGEKLSELRNEDDQSMHAYGGHFACVHWFRAVGRAA